jgi:hypothetical protein
MSKCYRLLCVIFFLLSSTNIVAQQADTTIDINKIFELRINAIEQVTTITKSYTYTENYLNYTIKNISKDTAVYFTNSCFYYNLYTFIINQDTFNVNERGGNHCRLNSETPHELEPNASFNALEEIQGLPIDSLSSTNNNISLKIPLRKAVNAPYYHVINGRAVFKTTYYLIYEGPVTVLKKTIDYRKIKKKKKSKKI